MLSRDNVTKWKALSAIVPRPFSSMFIIFSFSLVFICLSSLSQRVVKVAKSLEGPSAVVKDKRE